eukprot:352576-Chlamydomonas_euryale.AAC.2
MPSPSLPRALCPSCYLSIDETYVRCLGPHHKATSTSGKCTCKRGVQVLPRMPPAQLAYLRPPTSLVMHSGHEMMHHRGARLPVVDGQPVPLLAVGVSLGHYRLHVYEEAPCWQ